MSDALKKYTELTDSLDVNVFVTSGIGKKICKKRNLSADSLMQLGFQVSNYY